MKGAMAENPRIDDLAEAVQMLAKALSELTVVLAREQPWDDALTTTRRRADAAERITERVLIDR